MFNRPLKHGGTNIFTSAVWDLRVFSMFPLEGSSVSTFITLGLHDVGSFP